MDFIKIRKSSNQNVNSNFVRVDAKLFTDVQGDDVRVIWTFESDDLDTLLLHSGDAQEGSYLYYNDFYGPTLEITLPDDKEYTIIVKAQIRVYDYRDVPIVKLDENGEPYETTETLYTPELTDVTSGPLTIQKFTTGDWV